MTGAGGDAMLLAEAQHLATQEFSLELNARNQLSCSDEHFLLFDTTGKDQTDLGIR